MTVKIHITKYLIRKIEEKALQNKRKHSPWESNKLVPKSSENLNSRWKSTKQIQLREIEDFKSTSLNEIFNNNKHPLKNSSRAGKGYPWYIPILVKAFIMAQVASCLFVLMSLYSGNYFPDFFFPSPLCCFIASSRSSSREKKRETTGRRLAPVPVKGPSSHTRLWKNFSVPDSLKFRTEKFASFI